MKNESQIERLLENLPPDISPRLAKRLASAPWTSRAVKRRQALTVISLSVVALIAFMGLTPQGRAFAQTIFRFFTTTDKVSLPLSQEDIDSLYTPVPSHGLLLVEVTPAPLLPGDCSKPEAIGTYHCEVQRAEKQLGVDLKEFSVTPPNHTFTKIGFNKQQSVHFIWYESKSGWIILTQGFGDFPPDSDWEKVPVSVIKSIKIGNYDGEYVNGSFGVLNGQTRLTWSSGTDQRVRWKEEDRWFEILAMDTPETPGYLDKQALISLASNMVYQPNLEQTSNISIDFIPNITLAENICKCNLLEPAKLPEHMELDYVRYDPQAKSITFSYGWSALRIIQTPIESAPFPDLNSYKDVETIHIGDAVGQYGISPADRTTRDSSSSPSFLFNYSYSILLWSKNGMVYQIYFDQSHSNGGELTKEQMIKIAESLH